MERVGVIATVFLGCGYWCFELGRLVVARSFLEARRLHDCGVGWSFVHFDPFLERGVSSSRDEARVIRNSSFGRILEFWIQASWMWIVG